MAKPKKTNTIEIKEDLDFQQRSWKVQRVAWILMALISLAALLGLFGRGPASSAHAGSDESGLRIDYERFVRQESPGSITAHVGAPVLRPDSTVELWLDRQWLAEMELRYITPEPESTRIEADRVIYNFRVNPASAPVRVTWYLETHALGSSTGRIGAIGGPSLSFAQFAYP